tara:strand:- start:1877 stop:2857 length:981 start_codon:yes stop_codon:yes gene_type:complete
MKIAFLTRQYTSACSVFYATALNKMDADISFYTHIPKDEPIWKEFNIVLVMTYDHELCKHIKGSMREDAKLGIIDPRGSNVCESLKYCDFIVIDSIEMEDFWRSENKPIFRYAEYPDIGYENKLHTDKDQLTIGYHGNTLHLNEMANTITPALKNLSKKFNLKLLVMYNGQKPTGKEPWFVNSIETEHIPWSMENYKNALSKSDIGIVPNNLIVSQKQYAMINKNKNPDNYLLSFKMPSNPGRFITFGQLGIPVVADFFPSAIQYLQSDIGLIANSSSGWEYCLESLIKSKELRQLHGDNLQKLVKNKFDFKIQNKNFKKFLLGLS